MSTYKSIKMNSMEQILISLQMPSRLYNRRSILTLLAIGNVKESSKWKSIQEQYLRIHDIISFINENYPGKGSTDPKDKGYSENSRETIRKDTIQPFCELGIIESNEEVTNSGNNGYRFTKEFAKLLRVYDTDEWKDQLTYYKSVHESYAEKYNQKKNVDTGYIATFQGEAFKLERNAHNKLQKAILEKWVPSFTTKAELLYFGDTKNKFIKRDNKRLNELKIEVLENAKLPDIILYEETDKHKWLIFIEAYTSTGEITIERKSKLLEFCKNCLPDTEIIFLTAFQTMKKCKEKFLTIAWDTEIWVAEEETHMIHKNGDKFIGGHEK